MRKAILLGVVPALVAGCGGGTGVTLTIVPNVVGLQEGRATQEIVRTDGLRLRVARHSSETVPAGAVLRQQPLANSSVDPGSTITIIVSTGPAPSGLRSLAASPAAAVIADYLDAVQRGDCVKAKQYTRPRMFSGDGELCIGSRPGPIRFDRWRGGLPLRHTSAGDYEYGVELHVTAFRPAAGGIGTLGWHDWFLEARKGQDGYRLVAGGSGP